MTDLKRTVIVLGANADIGMHIAKYYLQDGFKVIGSYRELNPNVEELSRVEGVTLLKCDICSTDDIGRFCGHVLEHGIRWDTFFCSIGTSTPIGRFFETPFDAWSQSILVNAMGPLRLLHGIYEARAKGTMPAVVFLAGGGTNNPFRCYSAYCTAKIMLIKMCELLDDENPDMGVFIVGPGFVRTRTHLETLQAGSAAEDNYQRVREFWQSGSIGTSMKDIYSCIRWLRRQPRSAVSGRNFSVVHDNWGSESLIQFLDGDVNNYKLRRFGNDRGPKRQ